MKRKWLFLILAVCWLQTRSQIQNTPMPVPLAQDDLPEFTWQGTVTSYRVVPIKDITYLLRFVYDPTVAMVPATYPEGQPHYFATISVFKQKKHRVKHDTTCRETIRIDGYKHKWFKVGQDFTGQYTHNGCFEDVSEDIIKHAEDDTTKPILPNIYDHDGTLPGDRIINLPGDSTINFSIDTLTTSAITINSKGWAIASTFATMMDTAKAILQILTTDTARLLIGCKGGTKDCPNGTKEFNQVSYGLWLTRGYVIYNIYGGEVSFLDEWQKVISVTDMFSYKIKNW